MVVGRTSGPSLSALETVVTESPTALATVFRLVRDRIMLSRIDKQVAQYFFAQLVSVVRTDAGSIFSGISPLVPSDQ